MTNELYRLFNIKQTTFYGTKEDLADYNNGIGNSINAESNIQNIIKSFETNSLNKDKSYMICKLNDPYSIALLKNEKNKHNCYMLIYNYKTDKRVYSVDINDIPDTFNIDIVQKIINKTPQICKFTETMINKQEAKDIWMLDDLQNFADAIDAYDFDI